VRKLRPARIKKKGCLELGESVVVGAELGLADGLETERDDAPRMAEREAEVVACELRFTFLDMLEVMVVRFV